jgi:hypothetical protein
MSIRFSLLMTSVCMRHSSKEGYVLRKLQRGLSAINEDKTQAIYLSHRLIPPEAYFTWNEWNIPIVSNVKVCLCNLQ